MTALSASDYPPYYQTYISKVPAGDILQTLAKQGQEFMNYLQSLSPGKWDHAYAPGKWTVKEVVGHIADTEFIFGYRALSIARGEKQSLPGFDQDEYVASANFNSQNPGQLMEYCQAARRLNLSVFDSLDDSAKENLGTANNFPLRMKAIPFIIAGHMQHHFLVLKERYSE